MPMRTDPCPCQAQNDLCSLLDRLISIITVMSENVINKNEAEQSPKSWELELGWAVLVCDHVRLRVINTESLEDHDTIWQALIAIS